MISSVIFAFCGAGQACRRRLFSGPFLRLFSLALSAPCCKFCLHFAKALGRLRVFRRRRRLRLRVLEHREGDPQCAGSYDEHTVLPAQIRTEGAQKQQHHKHQHHQKAGCRRLSAQTAAPRPVRRGMLPCVTPHFPSMPCHSLLPRRAPAADPPDWKGRTPAKRYPWCGSSPACPAGQDVRLPQ